jgi:para-nitrobenzyl esterase
MNTYWVNFAKTGNPNGENLPYWPEFTLKKEMILDVQPDGNAVGKPDPRKARLDVVEKAFENRAAIQTRGGI